ncbi:uncharacterized protein MELLADRAFT_109976 [Melampsora larici-populina 98AG31]|uniref:Uncharacterized protein n=1 Tax=Melampsora larici-populina (strain 98AG31 / pathotype 3-4-7) TaxID=747676 RepID=F4RY87_MELLP|nr:uncharacterized protein MELLADRAFT_109976 [Melampsora larici-populina 98AG31]EGG02634.1 hypothetical protein MELLADRAFT_109976 [Melampsora larici-populina 98AG31]
MVKLIPRDQETYGKSVLGVPTPGLTAVSTVWVLGVVTKDWTFDGKTTDWPFSGKTTDWVFDESTGVVGLFMSIQQSEDADQIEQILSAQPKANKHVKTIFEVEKKSPARTAKTSPMVKRIVVVTFRMPDWPAWMCFNYFEA